MPSFKFPSVDGPKKTIFSRPKDTEYNFVTENVVMWGAPERQHAMVDYATQQIQLASADKDKWWIKVCAEKKLVYGFMINEIIQPGQQNPFVQGQLYPAGKHGIVFRRQHISRKRKPTVTCNIREKHKFGETFVKYKGPLDNFFKKSNVTKRPRQ